MERFSVSVEQLIPTQTEVTLAGLEKYMKQQNLSADPIEVIPNWNDDRYFLKNGHHRAAAQKLLGSVDIFAYNSPPIEGFSDYQRQEFERAAQEWCVVRGVSKIGDLYVVQEELLIANVMETLQWAHPDVGGQQVVQVSDLQPRIWTF